MKKFGRLLLVLVAVIFLQINVVNAASKCDYAEQVELNNAVANIKVSYEEAIEEIVYEADEFSEFGEDLVIKSEYFKIIAYNLTEDLYLKITNDYNGEVKYITFNDSESGTAIYEWKNLDKVTDFTIRVYSSNKTNCPNEEYRVMYLTTPKKNTFVDSAQCTGNEDFYLCKKYITEEKNIDNATFYSELEKFKKDNQIKQDALEEENNKSWQDNVVNFIKENKITIGIVSTLIVVGGVVTIIVVVKKQRRKIK